MAFGGQATRDRHTLGEGGWNVSNNHSNDLASLFTGSSGLDGFIANWKLYGVVSQQ